VNGHDDVLESAAYGVPSDLAEDEIMIAVVAREGCSIDPAAIVAHCRAGMAEFSVPRYVREVPELPKTPSQRIEKYKLREEGVTPDTFDATSLQEAAR
jgi:crotonobetaine/carnitine-CoA ligase